MSIAIAVLVVAVGALIAFIRHDMQRNPGRDWHTEEFDPSTLRNAVYRYPDGRSADVRDWASDPKWQAFVERVERKHAAEELLRRAGIES